MTEFNILAETAKALHLYANYRETGSLHRTRFEVVAALKRTGHSPAWETQALQMCAAHILALTPENQRAIDQLRAQAIRLELELKAQEQARADTVRQ